MLIDYVKTERSILGLAARHIGEVYVLSTVLKEVEGLDEDGCRHLGLRVIEPELSQLVAAAQKRGSLSTADHLCLILARKEGWGCVTNDRPLRSACGKEGILVFWGLELMQELVRICQLDPKDAIVIANAIHAENPLHITKAIVERFVGKLQR